MEGRSPESARAIFDSLNVVLLAGYFGGTLVQGIESQLLEKTASQKQTGAIRSSVIGQSDFDAVPGQLMGVSGADDLVAFDAGVGDLSGDVAVGQANDQTVLGGVVFVFVLDDEALAGVVVGLTLTTPLELDLEPLEVLLVLNYLHKTLKHTHMDLSMGQHNL